MTIEKMSLPACTVLELSGEIDLHSSGPLRSELKACSDARTPVLLIDFKRVGYIDSSGLAILIEYLKDAAKFDGKFALFGLEKKVATLFELVRLDQLFVIADDQEGALVRLGVSR
jgi:anti-sigma B factor antagonist